MTQDPGLHHIGGERLVVAGRYLQFRGDWPWLSETLGSVSHASGKFYFKCGTRKEDPWTDPNPHAEWRKGLLDHNEFMRSVAVRGWLLSVVWQIPGFLFNYVQMDFLHMGWAVLRRGHRPRQRG